MRGAANLRRQFGGFPSFNGISVRRIARWLRLTGGMPSVTGKDPAAHMLLIRDTMPEVYERTATFLNVLDWINLKLTGRTVATVDSILTSWVTDNRRAGRIRYSPALVADSGIDRSKLPPIVACTDVIGTLSPSAASFLGLPASIQVVAGAIDNSAAAIGAGTTRDNEPHLYIGTSSWIAAHVKRKKTDVAASIASVPCARPDRYLMTALQATAGANLTWLRDKLSSSPIRWSGPATSVAMRVPSSTPSTGSCPRSRRAPTACSTPPGCTGKGRRLTTRACGRASSTFGSTRTAPTCCGRCSRGVALNTRWLSRAVDKFLGKPVTSMLITGGGARSDAWCQIFADVLGIEIRRDAQPVAVNARGAGWIGAVGAGLISFADIPALMRHDRVFVPTPAHRATYDEVFEIYQDLHKRLGPVYHKLNARRP
jgi:xylulokinase